MTWDQQRCGTCTFFFPASGDVLLGAQQAQGRCRAIPPQIVALPAGKDVVTGQPSFQLRSMFPPVADQSASCGLYCPANREIPSPEVRADNVQERAGFSKRFWGPMIDQAEKKEPGDGQQD